jgi:hypothetical protein
MHHHGIDLAELTPFLYDAKAQKDRPHGPLEAAPVA